MHCMIAASREMSDEPKKEGASLITTHSHFSSFKATEHWNNTHPSIRSILQNLLIVVDILGQTDSRRLIKIIFLFKQA